MAARKPRPVGRRPTPRDGQDRPSTGMVVFVVLMLCVSLISALWLCRGIDVKTEAEQRPETLKRQNSLAVSYTYDGDKIRWYVMSDPDTGVAYLVNDRGGACPRLDRHGRVMGVEYDDE